MLYLYVTQIPADDNYLIALQNKLNLLLPWLPAKRQKTLQKIRHTQARLTSGVGLLLLRLGMHKLGINDFSLNEVIYSDSNKPHSPSRYDFNISHSSCMVVSAISDNSVIGIDTEKIRPIKREKFSGLLAVSATETTAMNSDEFFDLWTKKEAVLKADGTSGVWNRREVKVSGSSAFLKGGIWHLATVKLADDYVTNIASSSIITETDIKQIPVSVEELLDQTPNDRYL